MIRTLIITVVLSFAFFGGTSSAEGHSAAYNAAKARYYHANGIVTWIGNHARSTQYHPNPKRKHHWQQAVRFWLHVRRDAWLTMHPKPARTISGHWAGWSCITNGAYPGAAHEGNGYNGHYTGRLGMTNPWAGHSPSTGDWVTAPIAEVYGVAEAEAVKHRFADWWMRQQWPETYPPCAGYFQEG